MGNAWAAVGTLKGQLTLGQAADHVDTLAAAQLITKLDGTTAGLGGQQLEDRLRRATLFLAKVLQKLFLTQGLAKDLWVREQSEVVLVCLPGPTPAPHFR